MNKNESEYIEEALKKIDKYYYEVTGLNMNGDKYHQSAENAFTAEFYHQLKCSQETYSKDKLVWHFDINKMR
ncbi:MAG: hypothetical protein KYX68_11955, partial [Flavobacterium sp.]|nr:hypothetical protein [Flavobacterium sp.]